MVRKPILKKECLKCGSKVGSIHVQIETAETHDFVTFDAFCEKCFERLAKEGRIWKIYRESIKEATTS